MRRRSKTVAGGAQREPKALPHASGEAELCSGGKLPRMRGEHSFGQVERQFVPSSAYAGPPAVQLGGMLSTGAELGKMVLVSSGSRLVSFTARGVVVWDVASVVRVRGARPPPPGSGRKHKIWLCGLLMLTRSAKQGPNTSWQPRS